MKPVVTKVWTATWQGFETLVAGQCGNYGTVVVGIDKDAKAAYLYTFGHTNGAQTSITGHGKVPGTFADPAYFRWAPPVKSDWLFGKSSPKFGINEHPKVTAYDKNGKVVKSLQS